MLSSLGDVDKSVNDLSLESSCLDDENDGLGMDHLYTCIYIIIILLLSIIFANRRCVQEKTFLKICYFMIVEDQG